MDKQAIREKLKTCHPSLKSAYEELLNKDPEDEKKEAPDETGDLRTLEQQFSDLQEIGWKNLSKEQRASYSTLKRALAKN